jgi:hypothetical protein
MVLAGPVTLAPGFLSQFRFFAPAGVRSIISSAACSTAERLKSNGTYLPDALVKADLPESPILDPVDVKDRHVVVTAMVAQADAIVTFNLADFAASHLSEKLQIEVIHPDDFVDLVDLNEKRAVAAFRELRARKKNPPMDSSELIRRLRDGGLVQTSLWLNTSDVVDLI